MSAPSAVPQQSTTGRRGLTPEQARSLSRFSLTNAAIVTSALNLRQCACQPYHDVFTFNRWRAQNRAVRRGEHALAKIPVIVRPDGTESDGEDEIEQSVPAKLLRTSAVFCRCQTQEHKPYDGRLGFTRSAKNPDGTFKDRRDVDNGCECKSYVDILTAGRWRALGYGIRQGEHATFHGGKTKKLPLFCRCQVEAPDDEPTAAPLIVVDPFAPSTGLDIPGFEPVEPEPLPGATGSGWTIGGWINSPEPTPEPAPTLVAAWDARRLTMAPVAPDVIAEAPAQTIGGIPVVRLQLLRDSSLAAKPDPVSGPTSCEAIFRDFIGSPAEEHVVCLMLDMKNKPVGIQTISIGSLNSSIIAVREVFKAAVMCNAAAIILCHNHPSGDPTPSPEDVSITRKIHEAGQLLDIELLDHIVLGYPGFVSLRERNLGFQPI